MFRFYQAKNNLNILVLLIFTYLSAASYAGIYGDQPRGTAPNLGDASHNLASALLGISDLWLAVATIAGVGFFFIALIKYYEHRKNPQQTPISAVWIMLFMAVALISVSFIVQYGDNSYATVKRLFN